MHSLRGKRGLIGGLMFALAAAVALPVTAHAGPDPEAKRPNTGRYRLFAGNLGAITINRVYYGLNTRGEVGVDSLNSSTIGGGFWPKGTGNQYMFNSGLQVAGIIAGGAENPWAGDTTGGMFFDASGLRQHGTAVTELYNATSPVDIANWPQAAYVPQGDASEELFDNLLRGRLSASQGDVWFMSTEADPGLNAARPHPLGIVAEYRVLGWNFPSGNEDLLYLIVTFYNITSLNEADYAQYRPGLREILIQQAQQFHALNNATFSVDLPDAGYTIDPFYAAFSADPDVTNSANLNFSSVNLPFAMGYAYHRDFPRAAGWTFSPNIFGAPFFAGAGFVGIKYLKSATGPGEIALYSNTTNGGAFPDPNSAVRLYKYMSGGITPADGVACNHGDPQVSKICYVGNATAADVRMMQSSTPMALEAGQSASIVVSYIHAAPVAIPGYAPGSAVLPGDPRRLSDAALLAQGANRVDSIQGFRGYTDANGDGIVQQNEFRAVRGSLLDKANTAQTIFDFKFLLPFAPDAPDFFLIPGDGQVTVVWKPSATETDGDPYFAVAKDALVVPEGGGAPVTNALYDANYRQFDVEGYRIYRGRSDTPTGLKLIAQYDYSGTTFVDYTGQVVSDERGARCAPELPVTNSTCATTFDVPGPGVQLVKNVEYDITGSLVQVQAGNRTLLASGDVINLSTDTAVTGQASGYPALSNTGVPFAYIDNEPRNGLTYFYAVTAFDINSINSTGAGNTSLESARITKRVVPSSRAGNFVDDATVETGVFGRNGLLTDREAPVIDPVTGTWSKKALPTNAANLQLAAFVKELLAEPGEVSVRLDSIVPLTGGEDISAQYHYTLTTPTSESQFMVPFVFHGTNAIEHAEASFTALVANPGLAEQYDAPPGSYSIGGSYDVTIPGAYYVTNQFRACINSVSGLAAPQCYNSGPRWFSGENETTANPNSSNPGRWNTGLSRENFSNVGALPGVRTIYEPKPYSDYNSLYRQETTLMGLFATAADYHVYWGAAGVIDSVIDVTHDVVVPFSPRMGATWGILNSSAVNPAASFDQRAEITGTDIGCVEPMRTLFPAGRMPCTQAAALSSTAIPGPVAYGPTPSGAVNTLGDQTLERTHPAAAGQGFLFYIKGHSFVFELEAGLPEAGTVWKLRDYVGVVTGGNGRAGNFGNYGYNFPEGQVRPFTAIGSSIGYAFNVTNQMVASTEASLAEVHTVPDPYYVTSALEATTTSKKINFVNLPAVATIRIYTTSGVLVRALKHETTNNGGETTWDVRNRNNQFVASGVYFYHVTAENGETTVGRMTIINYAQ